MFLRPIAATVSLKFSDNSKTENHGEFYKRMAFWSEPIHTVRTVHDTLFIQLRKKTQRTPPPPPNKE